MEKKWYVKSTAGKVFGPIDLETLKGWVKDGRIEPLAGISSDLKNWMLAPLKPELEMNWVVENEPGQFYGPTHRNVLDDLKKAGSLSREARFFLDDRGAGAERMKALEGALAAKDAELARREKVLAEAQKLSGKKDLQLASAQKTIAQRDDRIAADVAALAQRDGQIAELSKAVVQKEGERARAEQALADRDAEVQGLRAELEQFKGQVARLKEEMERRQAPHAREWSSEVVEPEIVVDEMPPPVARQAFDFGSASALADLERRAQQELARMGPIHAKKFFTIKK